MNDHLSPEEIQEFVYGSLASDHHARAGWHISRCESCRSEVRIVRSIEDGLKQFPHDSPSRDFTGQLMRQLGIQEVHPFFWSLLKNLAPLVAMTMVAGIVVGAFYAGGIMEPQSSGSPSIVDFRPVSILLAEWVDTLNVWVVTYTSFLGTDLAFGIFLFTLMGLIAVADRFILMPLFRRKSYRH